VLTALRDKYFNCSYDYLTLNSFVVLLLPAFISRIMAKTKGRLSTKSAVKLKMIIIFGTEFDSPFYFLPFCYSDLTDKC
jgi:hypothetical protein